MDVNGSENRKGVNMENGLIDWKQREREAREAIKIAAALKKLAIIAPLCGTTIARLTQLLTGAKFKDVVEITQIHGILCEDKMPLPPSKQEMICNTCGSSLIAKASTQMPVCLDCRRAKREDTNISGGCI